jgi:Glycosyl transferases group 1
MKLAIFYIRQSLAGWYTLGGYVKALKKMGHTVLDCALPANQIRGVSQLRSLLPDIEQLATCDAVVSFYHEYAQPWLKAIYGIEPWQKLIENVPIIARFDESVAARRDLNLPARMPELLAWANRYSFPAAQDAEKFGGAWHPFGADRTMFHVEHQQAKLYDVGFIGSMYQPRINYLAEFAKHTDSSVTFHCSPVWVRDLGGIREPDSTRLLVENYRALKIFFCLPPLSQLIVAKVFDVMACGTFVMYPKLPGDAAKNLTLFEDGKHIAYYDQGYMIKNFEQIKYWLEHEKEREDIARAGCYKVTHEHTLERMIEGILGLAKSERKERSVEVADAACAGS